MNRQEYLGRVKHDIDQDLVENPAHGWRIRELVNQPLQLRRAKIRRQCDV